MNNSLLAQSLFFQRHYPHWINTESTLQLLLTLTESNHNLFYTVAISLLDHQSH